MNGDRPTQHDAPPPAGLVEITYARPASIRLEHSDRRYVKNLATATGIILVGIFVNIGIAGLSVVAQITRAPQVLMNVLSLAPSTILLVGIWKLTAPDPVLPMSARRPILRWLARSGALAALGKHAAAVLFHSLNHWEPYFDLAAIGLFVSSLAGGIGELIGFFALFGYFRALAQRIPDRGLARQTRTVMWGFTGATLFIFVSIFAISFTIAITGGSGNSGHVCCLAVLFLLLLFAFGLWWLILLVRYRRLFQLKAGLAKRLTT